MQLESTYPKAMTLFSFSEFRCSVRSLYADTRLGKCLYRSHTHSGRSGLAVACFQQRERSQDRTRAADKFLCFSRKSLRYTALGTGCTLTAVPSRLSLQPSEGW